jgi:hypothetical protein
MPATNTTPPNLKIDIELWYDSEIARSIVMTTKNKKQNKNKTAG